jgi:hypothetical protein
MRRSSSVLSSRFAAILLASTNKVANHVPLGSTEKARKLSPANAKSNFRHGFIQPLSFPNFYLIKMRRWLQNHVLASHDKPISTLLFDQDAKWLHSHVLASPDNPISTCLRRTTAVELSDDFRKWLAGLPCRLAKIRMGVSR